MPRPRLLLVSQITELEWAIKPLLEEWAEVASYDAPGVGAEPGAEHIDIQVLVARATEEIDRRGWDRCIVAGDEFASALAVLVADARPDVVEGLALGHAALSFEAHGAEAPIEATVLAAFMQLLDTDYRSWVRAYTQVTLGAYDDEMMERFLERVPPETARRLGVPLLRAIEDLRIEPILRRLGLPLLFAEHRGCLIYTREGFEAAQAAFPDARIVSTEQKPNCSAEFASALEAFCRTVMTA